MKISFECPISLLDKSVEFNDYHYCLAHLYDKNKQYKKFYLYHHSEEILLDNSAYELRDSDTGYFNYDKYVDIINELNPSTYIVPDAFNDYKLNKSMCDTWFKKYEHEIHYYGRYMAVMGIVHGETYKDMIQSYKDMRDNPKIDIIGINFDEKPYSMDIMSEIYGLKISNISVNKALNRYMFIQLLIQLGIIDTKKKHHILGCHVPNEIVKYNKYPWIYSADTSNPIMAGIERTPYVYPDLLLNKPKMSIDKCLVDKLDEEQLRIIEHNVKLFKLKMEEEKENNDKF